MKFQPGDKVKFLNEVGGGVVTRIIDSATVEVAIEEGFDVPIKITDLIKVASTDASGKLFDVDYKVVSHIVQDLKAQQPYFTETTNSFNASDRPEGIYIAIKPHDQKMLIAGYVDVMIINHTPYDALYNIYQKVHGAYTGADYGSIGPRALAVVDTCERQSIEPWLEGLLQVMFHMPQPDEVIKPLEIPYKIRGNKLISEDQYVKTSFIDGRIFALQLFQLPGEDVSSSLKPVQVKAIADKALIEKHRVDDGFAEVDLHIQALVDDLKRLDPQQIITIQLDYLKKCLESAIVANFHKVIFIHGVGAGILKIEIRKILDEYEFVEYYDASIAKYGIGATEVLIHKKR